MELISFKKDRQLKMAKDFAEERRGKLLEYIKAHNRADVAELAQLAQVTEATIRRDLTVLEQDQLVHRTHGGAIPCDRPPALWQTTALQERVVVFQKEKERIAMCVAEMIQDGDSIMMDGGSTTLAVAQHLMDRKKKVLVVTNATTIGELLVSSTGTRVIVTGGEMIAGTLTMAGPLAEEVLRGYRTDKAIIGVSGILLGDGIFAAIPLETEIKRLMIESSVKTILVADSSKIGTRALCRISEFNNKFTLVTDNGISRTARNSLKNSGVEVVVV